ncbi:indole-3-glycerol phosphate synthase [Bisgaardia hudsonensis]|uniref:Multifunctional fusion protein n=1 Tax=Bisgaardia hudsonensis TaxID=109472 RepID=A0A4V2SJ40_9PAST|nr:bifunctional indole-3-glycerol-phosphate synthase TrpC/phosphoribosylanthranilate isomerase TrpF [Bisgaardia hudsonensis]QLB13469.1 bifunctional indole-3-glycerol phosphate synthase/phosphoribosylanthranilate isomerase [Bisgaardia hudsonensis]TCP12878.1 indole-3-glycerol phosphate synthase [Bisgaardia hudsonensis]
MTQQPTILQKIVQDKKQWIIQKQAEFPLTQFKHKVIKSDRTFYDELSKGNHQSLAFILECKKSSPSKGLIRENFNLSEIANSYKSYASVISVLTDEKYFQGNFAYINEVRKQTSQPILCKDFIISEYQVYLARYFQADAILLMLSVIDDKTYQHLANLAHQLNMGVLTEASTSEEVKRAIKLNAKVIGINNRDLHTLTIDLNRTIQLANNIPNDRIIISESGIYTHNQIMALKPYVNGFLIGSSLMANQDLENAIRAIIFGENKVCGLTRGEDIKMSYQCGALYGGLIFAEKSLRKVSLAQAKNLIKQAPLRFVGIFQNQPVDFIVNIANELSLFAIQLHGMENSEFITALRQALPQNCQIWKAISVDINHKTSIEIEEQSIIDRYVLDSQLGNQQGGTGKKFDWSIIPIEMKNKIMLAGGINNSNIQEALRQHCLGIDINSGVEQTAGIKDPQKLLTIFKQINTF